MDTLPLQDSSRAPLKIAAIYLLLAVLWIVFSDQIAYRLVHDSALITQVQTIKGWFFVISTACLIFFLLRREITTYQTTANRLRESRQELRDILDAMPVGIALTDGVTIEYINVNFSERFGYSLDEIPTDEQWFRFAYPDPAYREPLIAAWRTALDKAKSSGAPIPPFEVKVTCKDGMVRHVIANTQLIRNRILIILTDITERELLHNERVKMQKLESIGVLAGGIAHDFNNILTGIMGNLSFALMLMESAHAAYKPLQAAEKASVRAAELTRQLLTFAQGGQPIKKAVSVQHLVGEAMALMLQGTNVRGETTVDNTVSAIEADEGQISQVFNNIILNAVQAMPGGGTLRVAARNERVESVNSPVLAAGEYVVITFSDEGCGIPPEMLERIFDPYFSTKISGSGLGLASAHSIVTRHGGSITAASVIGKGTTFTLYLPATSKPLPQEQPGNIVQCAGGHDQAAILVMDDEEVIRDVAAEMLTHLGYRVTVCADGETAIRLAAEAMTADAPFAAIIMDLTIPAGMGGEEAARKILALDAGARLIVSSGYSHDPIMADYLSHGFSGVLAKPYKVVELGQVLEAVLVEKGSS